MCLCLALGAGRGRNAVSLAPCYGTVKPSEMHPIAPRTPSLSGCFTHTARTGSTYTPGPAPLELAADWPSPSCRCQEPKE